MDANDFEEISQPPPPAADTAGMPRRLLVRLLRRLDASPLPATDPVRLDLEAELLGLLTPTLPVQRPQSAVVRVHEDACGTADTSLT